MSCFILDYTLLYYEVPKVSSLELRIKRQIRNAENFMIWELPQAQTSWDEHFNGISMGMSFT